MMRNLVIIALVLFSFACKKGTKVPHYVIPKEDMINIIIDIHVTDGLFTVTKVRRELVRNDSLNYYDEIFTNYGYTRKDFDTSVYFYSKNINEYDKIYQEVLNRLNEMETELKQQGKEEGFVEELIDN